MYEEREHSRRGKVTGNGTLFLNARSSIIRTLPDLDLRDPDIREVLFAIYHNALMLGSQGGKTGLSSATARTIFEANNRTINNLMGKIREVRDLKNQVRSASPQKQTPPGPHGCRRASGPFADADRSDRPCHLLRRDSVHA